MLLCFWSLFYFVLKNNKNNIGDGSDDPVLVLSTVIIKKEIVANKHIHIWISWWSEAVSDM